MIKKIDICYSSLYNTVVVIQWGVNGYFDYLQRHTPEEAEQLANELNDDLGVTVEESREMLIRSMWGKWD